MRTCIWTLFAALPACSASAGAPPEGTLTPGEETPAGMTPQFPGGQSGGVDNGPPTGFNPAVPQPSDPSGEGACTGVSQMAEKRAGGNADIVIAVDNSLSMGEEAAAVQNNLNTFSNRITTAGIDVRVTLISAPPPASGMQCIDPTGIACIFVPGLTIDSTGICLEPPLGAAGACPGGDDSNPAAGYLHVRTTVDSHNALSILQSTFGQWQTMLRPDAAKTIVVVTDDESEGTPNGAEFEGWVNSQPLFQSAVWRFSGVFCSSDSPNCANIGSTYASLVQDTGGISGDLAEFATGQVDAQFATLIDSLADAVVQDAVPVDCEWTIPPPPDGESLDPDAVNVQYTNAAGAAQTIYGVASLTECTDQYGGWYYDNPAAPARVVACPQSCTTIQADPDARIDVLFGCAREEPPIE